MMRFRRSARLGQPLRRDVPLDEQAMIAYARTLAQALKIDGAAHLRMRAIRPSALRRLSEEAHGLTGPETAGTPAMEWLMDNARLIESQMHTLCADKGERLPAAQGVPRIQLLMRELVKHGDALVDKARLMGTLQAFDEVVPLRMAELWAAPSALKAELCAAFVSVGEQVLLAQRERLAAEEWVRLGAHPDGIRQNRRSNTFYERALQLMHEQESPQSRRMLEDWLERHEAGAGAAIQLAHADQALSRLLLSNIMNTIRMLDALDWLKCFEALSRTEHQLREDPAGTYPRMDEDSRSCVRNQLAKMARSADLSEITVARQAVGCALHAEGELKRNVCWWLYDDEGRVELMRALDAGDVPIRKLVPDPQGSLYLGFVVLLGLAFFALFFETTRNFLFALIALPLCWCYAAQLINHISARLVRPVPLLKLSVEHTPDALRTLIVIPALLSSEARARETLEQLMALGCQQRDDNIDLLLLGDFRDGPNLEEADDLTILALVKREIKKMNERAGREQFFYLHRHRAPCETQDNYMGHERKRGALMALNQLLLTGESSFGAEGAAAGRLHARGYVYVLSLDAGTLMLPGTTQRMIGAMAHPLNARRFVDGARRGYALLQPRMEHAQLERPSRFARLLGGQIGVDSYPSCVSEVYQDLIGQGVFGGKGIYDLRAFHEALQGKLPDGAILSHDLLEGLIAGAGTLCDVALYDAFPKTPSGYFSRMNRWTRGDWQLIPFIGRLGLSRFARYLMIDNLRRSLSPVAALAMMLVGMWANNGAAILIGLLYPFVPVMLCLPHVDKNSWASAALRLSLLPIECYQLLDASLRTLHRLYVSKKRLLSWITAADAEKDKAGVMLSLPGRVVSLLMLPALVHPGLFPLLVGLWMLFLTPSLQLQDDGTASAFDTYEQVTLSQLAKDTWRFFETQVPVAGNGLPPDNLQLNPAVGAARRTSPTNIGLYLTSCLAAHRLEALDHEQMLMRMQATVETLEKLDKWNGQLFNWYDIDTLQPLRPRYVSSVDGGNLAACLLACAAAIEKRAEALSRRMEALVSAMQFRELFDEQRKLFVIGVDVEHERLSGAHYDLLASESRILSFVAMALGQAPVKHWPRLGRAQSHLHHGQALTSWSGTMFEYLMPELFLKTPEQSMLGATNRAVVRVQKDKGGSMPWGVSESGYNAFDLQMNYQYRAFGLPELSLRGESYERVIAPYASLLALPIEPKAVLRNLQRMKDMGLWGEYGFYEAVDCAPSRVERGESYHIVKSFMAHHQGMILCALFNALKNDELARHFMNRPEVRALLLLLCEKQPRRVRSREHKPMGRLEKRQKLLVRPARTGAAGLDVPDTHLLYGGGGTCLLSADGRSLLRVNGVMANRWQLASGGEDDGLFVHIRLIGKNLRFLANGGQSGGNRLTRRVNFDVGSASWTTRADELEVRCIQCVSPEDGALVQQIALQNQSEKPLKLELTSCFAVALASQADMQAHPVFQNLFVESATAGEHALVFRRRPRDEKATPLLVHLLFGGKGDAVSRESDLSQLIGREGSLSNPFGLAKKLSGTVGRVLDPCSALRIKLVLAPGEKRELGFAIGLAEDDERAVLLINRYAGDAARRALALAQTQARAMLDFLNISGTRHQLLQRGAAFLHWPRLRFLMDEGPVSCSISALWPLGVSGDLPIIAAFIGGKDQLELAREAVRAHEFYRVMGVWCDLLLINDYGNNYEQPVRDGLRDLVANSHLRELTSEPGGVFVLEGATLQATQRQLIRAVASIALIGDEGPLNTQLSRRLGKAEPLPERAHSAPPEPPAKTAPGAQNGWGAFTRDGGYMIELQPGKPTPAPWCNVLANPHFGTLITERGGGFSWQGSSRFGRLTPFGNSPLKEGFSERLFVRLSGQRIPLLPEPGAKFAFRVVHRPGETRFESAFHGLSWRVSVFVDPERPLKCSLIELKNTTEKAVSVRLEAELEFLMGASADDARLTRAAREGGMLLARGAMGGVGFFELPEAEQQIDPGQTIRAEALLGWADDPISARALLSSWRESGGGAARLKAALTDWDERLGKIAVKTPEPLMNAMVNRWLPYQALSARVFGRTGLYQPGGAFGFRDQLQDMLCLIPIEPELVRAHLLLSAAHQFEQGDVQHWWHPERTGVRTRISDDLLFLPYVAAQYVRETGDAGVLDEKAPYLKADELPEGVHDSYATPPLSEVSENLHSHCLRAIRRAASLLGGHGLPLMGAGDWNDGMNLVGFEGKGESVWLGEFLAVAAREYAGLCAQETERNELLSLSEQMKQAVERAGWDGAWYRRAYFDGGSPLGSAETPAAEGCQIDAIAQSWAVLAGLDPARTRSAMDAVWARLVDQDRKLIRLLTPPFDGPQRKPGYIMGYPPGVRENGGQYTHGACWVVAAYAVLGQAERAWAAYEMLMPYTHSQDADEAVRYRVEPYVVAADVYSGDPNYDGRGGWTWYTGAAAWLQRVMLQYLLGYERRGNQARLCALLPRKWDSVSLVVRVGASRYTLIGQRAVAGVSLDGKHVSEFIELRDDGKTHTAIFPARAESDE